MKNIRVNHRIEIPEGELKFTFSRSQGPGGQNVNKVNSKATLHWSFVSSNAIPDDLRERLTAKLATKLTNEGEIVLQSQRFRDQAKNIEDCCDKLADLLREALFQPKKRHKTKPTKGSVERRITAKKLNTMKKQSRTRFRED